MNWFLQLTISFVAKESLTSILLSAVHLLQEATKRIPGGNA